MMANLYFFIATLKKVVDGFSGQKANLKSQGKDDKKAIWETNKKQFLTISRLLILMGETIIISIFKYPFSEGSRQKKKP